MASFEQCSTCKQWGWTDSHRCPPIYLVWDPDYEGNEDQAEMIYADTPEKAAEIYGKERSYDGDGLVEDLVVFVKLLTDDGPPKKLRILSEMVPNFWTEEVDDDEE
jgi:hypothetical protein